MNGENLNKTIEKTLKNKKSGRINAHVMYGEPPKCDKHGNECHMRIN